ncbi:MAG: DsbE family thiol:disulfide interchange protein, partial [Rhodobacteraceae bacterium]|nr:DsbE family thiol:disulfide interchange protein [Paracoccaceae bacterium]
NFWASWCPPCRLEHETLLDLAAQGYRVAGVNIRDDAEKATAYLDENGTPFFASGFDPKGRTSIDWGVTAPPETFIVDGNGVVLFRFAGPLVDADFETRFLPALKEAEEN